MLKKKITEFFFYEGQNEKYAVNFITLFTYLSGLIKIFCGRKAKARRKALQEGVKRKENYMTGFMGISF